MVNVEYIKREFSKCYSDKSRIYMIENYFTTLNGNETVAFKLFPRQKDLLNEMARHNNIVTTKPRQAGISTVTAAKLACELALATSKSPETALIVANKLDLSQLVLVKVKEFLLQVPRWFWGSEYYGTPENEKKTIFVTENKSELELINGSKIHAKSSGRNAARGVSAVSWLIFDEAAFIEDGKSVYAQAVATTASVKNARIIMISTPNGKDELYFDTYNKSMTGNNNFKIVELKWYEDPRYNKFLKWERTNKKTGDVEVIEIETIKSDGSIEYTPEYWEKLTSQGYKPTSPWYVKMSDSFNNDKVKIAQELDISFQGSAGTIVDEEVIQRHKSENMRKPIFKDDFFVDALMFSEPIEGHRYVMPIDVSTGSSEDASGIHIFDIDAVNEKGLPIIEQVFEYNGKLRGDVLAEVANKYGRIFGNALAIVDCVGSSGDATLIKLQEMKYPNIYSDDPNLKNITNENAKFIEQQDEVKVIGFRAGYLRNQMLMNLETMLRDNSFIPRSGRFMAELDTWIWKNGRPDHQTGFHDDLITSAAMGLFVYIFSIKRLEKVKKDNISALNAMIAVQKAMNSGSVIVSEKVKQMPMPFYTNNSIRQQNNVKQKYTKSQILNIYLNSKLDSYS